MCCLNLFLYCESDEAQQAEAVHVLNSIFEKRESQSEKKTDCIAKIAHATAMLYYLLHDIDKVR